MTPSNPVYSQCIPTGTTSTTSSSTTSRATTTSTTTTSRATTTSTSTTSRVTTTVSVSTRSVSNPTLTIGSSTTAASSTPTGYQIRTVSDPIYHFYLQSLSGLPVLGPEASGGYFNISGSIRLNSSPYQYLNIVNSTTSYKTLTFDSAPTFTNWALEGDTIITSSSSAYGRQLNFLACPVSTSGYYQLFLQTGSDVPSSSCITQGIHLPCLC